MGNTYNHFFVRSFAGDTNAYPKPSRSTVWTSPDIIPYGTQVCKNPKEEFLANNFDRDFGQDIYHGLLNYLYVRGHNFKNQTVDCDLYLHWSTNTMLLAPNSWKRHKINSNKNKDHISLKVGAGAWAVTGDEANNEFFVWQPEKIDDGHYCLISRVVSKEYPAPIPDLTNIDDFSIFLRSEEGMGYAQRNLRYKNAQAPSDIIIERIENDMDHDICDAYIMVNCYNLPVGSAIQMSCPGSHKECYLEIPKTTITSLQPAGLPHTYASKIDRMPMGFDHPIYVYFWSNGQKVPATFSIQLDFVYIPTSNAKSAELAVPFNAGAFQLLVEGPEQLLESANAQNAIKPKKGIRVGSCETIYK